MKYELRETNTSYLLVHAEENRNVIWFNKSHFSYEECLKFLDNFNKEDYV